MAETHAVDFVLKVMGEISSSKPVLFQRDGSLYVASEEGFGQVTYGLRTEPENIQPWERRGQSPEITESVDGIKERSDGKLKFLDGEQKYLKAIAFGPDYVSFSLEEITADAQKLAGLPDDGKVRMICHSTRYHSHKFGYGADGIDVNVEIARVMDRNRYLELIREKEDKLIQAIEQMGETRSRRDISESYKQIKIPDGVIVTPYMIISLPRRGRLHSDTDRPDSWTLNTRLDGKEGFQEHYGSILHHRVPSTYNESPFKVSVTLNAHNLENVDAGDKLLERIGAELNAVKSNIAIADSFVAKMNAAHNTGCALDIKENKSWKQRRDAEATAQ